MEMVVEMERSERLGLFCKWKPQDLQYTDFQGEGKEIKVDSSFIWLSTWVVELPFSGRGTSWRWGS